MSKPNTVLAIDTSHSNYSLAIVNSNGVLSEINMIKEENPSEKLIELIEKSLRKANLDLHDLDCIAVGVGPGNFTGIRIGISVAKGIALALDIKCIGINRFRTLVFNDSPTLTIINIKDDLYFTQIYEKKKPISDPIEENFSKIINKKYNKQTIVSGDNSLMISQKLNLKCDKKNSIPKASELGTICINSSDLHSNLPSPFYVKGPDAKLPTQPPPKIL